MCRVCRSPGLLTWMLGLCRRALGSLTKEQGLRRKDLLTKAPGPGGSLQRPRDVV